MIKLGINGFGRIGRLALRVALQEHKDKILPVAINTSGKIDPAGWAHLFEYDSTYRKFEGKVESDAHSITVNRAKIAVTAKRTPAEIPWGKYDVDLVIESTGVFRRLEEVKEHLKDSVKKVILSATPKDDKIPMFVIGVNEKSIGNNNIISCASCTTNCAAPVAKTINEALGIKKALMTTIHAYTSGQKLLDGSHKDLRRARAAAVNIVPTTTGAAEAVAKIYPPLKNKFTGMAVRVPVATGSMIDFVFLTSRETNTTQVNSILKQASEQKLKGIMSASNKPTVSSDIINSPLSALVDLSLTQVIDKNLVKIVAWYDNEWGYANRLVEEAVLLAQETA